MADWRGEFGDLYTVRNMGIPDRTKFFKRFLPYDFECALEIGCNWGANLISLSNLGIRVTGCDVNESAVKLSRQYGLDTFVCSGTEIPEKNNAYDLVFTIGVLIHQQTPELIKIMKEMVRISSDYVLFAEYNGTDEEVPYRGERYALFKREFGRIFEALFPEATLVEQGHAGRELGFDDVTYWLYDVSNCSSKIRLYPPSGEGIEEGEEQEFIVTSAGTFRKVDTD